MKGTGAADQESRIRSPRRFLVTVLLAGLLLSVQTGLSFHGASHVHGDEDGSDCSLCFLGSHFAAEPVEFQLIETLGFAGGLPREHPEGPVPFVNLPTAARGPPTASD